MKILSSKKEEFETLFAEFIDSYPHTPKGIERAKSYSQQRESATRNYQAILEAKESGEDITDKVLLQLIPYENTQDNRQQNKWIHTTPAITKDLKTWFEKNRWTKHENWKEVARLILHFVSLCFNDVDNFSIPCQSFYRSQYSKDLNASFMTPILNALKPDRFILIDDNSLFVINYFADTNYSQAIIDYPAVNKIGKQLIKELSSITDRSDIPALRQEDIFNMFCHWLVAEKKYNFKFDELQSDRITKFNPDKSRTKKEESMSHINTSSDYFRRAFVTMGDISLLTPELKKLYSKLEEEVKKLFIKICDEVINKLASHIKLKLFTN